MAIVQPAADRSALRASPRKSIGRRLRQSFWGYFFIAPGIHDTTDWYGRTLLG